jgi:hypothetical protein
MRWGLFVCIIKPFVTMISSVSLLHKQLTQRFMSKCVERFIIWFTFPGTSGGKKDSELRHEIYIRGGRREAPNVVNVRTVGKVKEDELLAVAITYF